MKTTPTTSGKTVVVGAYTFDQENARKELSVMVCLHEYPLSIVDHIGFRRFCNALQPLFKVITRNTLKSDILKLYNDERSKTMNVLERNKSQVAITTDMWTASNQNKGYMAIKAHYIDDSWKLQSRLVRFIYVPAPHTAEVLLEVLVDCLMDWNLDRKVEFNILMLEVAIMYRDVFERLSLCESQYKSLPSEKDWDMPDEIFQRLRLALMEWKNCGNEIIEMMATSMITKFEKYWDVINTVMAIGTLLDPRYEMYLLNFFFRKIYGEMEACVVIGQVKRVVQDLVLEYATKGRERDQAAQLDMLPPPSIPSSSKGRKFSHEDWQADFAAHVSEESTFINTKSELDYYLEERPVPQTEHNFDILNWWKSNGAKFSTLQAIARDFLAIPISTIASESSFITGGRFVTPHRSRLHLDTLEALMCNQDWLWNELGTTTNIGFECYTIHNIEGDVDVRFKLEVAVHPFTLVGVAVPVHWSCCAFSICRQLAISAGEDIISGRRGGGADSDSGDTDYQSLSCESSGQNSGHIFNMLYMLVPQYA
ncbi:zinc finger BED domain-containing protein RICESLEEPER 2-like [Arachis hypogaea]|uniref:zinc finger BED domain-containing protein RICESLEEPER 2-like n=1 Tax=Arachis hypogaea TaxID=3818 RepID=UPI003B216EB7